MSSDFPGTLEAKVKYIVKALDGRRMTRAELDEAMTDPTMQPYWDSLAGTTQNLGDTLYHAHRKGLLLKEKHQGSRLVYWAPEARHNAAPVESEEAPQHNAIEAALAPLEGLTLPIDRALIPFPSYAALYPYVIKAIEKLGGEADCRSIRTELGLEPTEAVVGEGMVFSWAMAEMRELGYLHTVDHPTRLRLRLYRRGNMAPDPAETYQYKPREPREGGEPTVQLAATVPVAPRAPMVFDADALLERATQAKALSDEHDKTKAALGKLEEDVLRLDTSIEERGNKITDGSKRYAALQRELEALKQSLWQLRNEDEGERAERDQAEKALNLHRERLAVVIGQMASLFNVQPTEWTEEPPIEDNVVHMVKDGHWLVRHWTDKVINYLLRFQLHGPNDAIGDLHQKIKHHMRKRAEEMNPTLVRTGVKSRKITDWSAEEVAQYGVSIMWEVEEKLRAKFGHRYTYTHMYNETRRKFALQQAEAVEKHQAAGTAE